MMEESPALQSRQERGKAPTKAGPVEGLHNPANERGEEFEMQTGNQVTVVSDNVPIEYDDGTKRQLRRGAIAGGFSDFVAGDLVEVFTNHPETGEPVTAIVPAWGIQVFDGD